MNLKPLNFLSLESLSDLYLSFIMWTNLARSLSNTIFFFNERNPHLPVRYICALLMNIHWHKIVTWTDDVLLG